jgi:hypothetical protein
MQFTNHLSHVYGRLVHHLKKEHGVDSVLFVRSKSMLPPDLAAIGLDLDAFVEVIDLESMLKLRAVSDIPPPGELASRAVGLEKNYGISAIEILRTDRHLGINFAPGAEFPRSGYGRASSYEQSIDLICRLVEFYFECFEKYQPIALLGSPGAIYTASQTDLLPHFDIPLRYPVKARWQTDDFHWVMNRAGQWLGHEEAYIEALSGLGSTQDVETNQPVLGVTGRMQSTMDSITSQYGLRSLLLDLALTTAREIKRRLKRRGDGYGNYLLMDNLALRIKQWRWHRKCRREKPVMASMDQTMPFVFFPLQTEPEANLMGEVPGFDHHLAAIDYLAKGLPGGWYLVVKEHPAQTAPRPKRFWKAIRRYPNVIVAATLENGEDLLERSNGLAMINSSLGYQAAVVGKPVLSFHRQHNAVVMPHVFPVRTYEEVQDALSKIANGELASMEERLKTGRAFVQAMEACSFPIADAACLLGKPGKTAVDDKVAAQLADDLMKSLPSRDERTRKKSHAHASAI